MASYSILPNTNLKVSDVRDTLNENGGTTDNTFGSLFSSSANINMWSKFKPVIHTQLFLDGDGRWKGKDEKCGITIPTYSSASTLRTALVNGSAMWSYTPPNGSESQPLRIGDFRDYNAKAVNPIGELFDEYFVISDGTEYNIDIQVEIIIGSEDGDYNLTLNDISVDGTKLTDMYLGVYLVPKSGSGYFFGTSSNKIGTNDSLTMTLPVYASTKGEYTAYLFLATTPQVEQEQGGIFISLNKLGKTINIIQPENIYQIDVYGMWKGSNSFEYEITITNDNSTSTTFENLRMYLVRASQYDDLFDNYFVVKETSLASSVIVGTGSNNFKKYTGTETATKDDSYYYGLFVSSTTPAITTDVIPMDEDQGEDG